LKQLALLLLVGVLSASTSGILDLMVPERCSVAESASAPADGQCASTCVRCHCARAFEFVLHFAIAAAPHDTAEWLPPAAFVPQLVSHDILHVPKPALS
jgi:hypothetical protein